MHESSVHELSALLLCSNKQPPVNSGFHVTLMDGRLNGLTVNGTVWLSLVIK